MFSRGSEVSVGARLFFAAKDIVASIPVIPTVLVVVVVVDVGMLVTRKVGNGGEFLDVRLSTTECVALLQTGMVPTVTHGCLPASWLLFDLRRHELQGRLPCVLLSP